MIKKYVLLGLFWAFTLYAQEKLPLIPYPQKVEIKEGEFYIPKTLILEKGTKAEFYQLIKTTFSKYGFKTEISDDKNRPNLVFYNLPENPNDTFSDKEKYTLNINKKLISIKSKNETGAFYAIQTLIQLLNYYKNTGKIPYLDIEDGPKFSWRGMHLDCVRHFFTKEEVKQYIDYLVLYKMNTFHWHLTDDQGWRIEIKKYPKLTQIGAWRNGSMVGPYKDHKVDTIRYGGFYTQEDIKEIVTYATERHINIIPEIEMPGHAVAAIASYPELGCTGKPIEVEKTWGVFKDIMCPKEETFTFLENVLTEVMALFPSKIIHIGGDEAPKTQWKESAYCQELIKKLGLKNEEELQSYFIQRIEKFLNAKGREIIGWDEILEGGLAPNAKVMSWRGEKGGIDAANQHHYAVMTPGSYCYLDHYQANPKTEPLAIGGYLPLEKVYGYNPIPSELETEKSRYILGAQGNLWTEYITDFKKVQYMAFPRICALSEVVWGTNKDYTDFKQRLKKHFLLLDQQHINYSTSTLEAPLKKPE